MLSEIILRDVGNYILRGLTVTSQFWLIFLHEKLGLFVILLRKLLSGVILKCRMIRLLVFSILVYHFRVRRFIKIIKLASSFSPSSSICLASSTFFVCGVFALSEFARLTESLSMWIRLLICFLLVQLNLWMFKILKLISYVAAKYSRNKYSFLTRNQAWNPSLTCLAFLLSKFYWKDDQFLKVDLIVKSFQIATPQRLNDVSKLYQTKIWSPFIWFLHSRIFSFAFLIFTYVFELNPVTRIF